MEAIITVILEAGKSGLNLALYVMLPVMVVMLALMKVLEARGILAWVARRISPAMRIFGLPGLGVFAMMQLLMVSFAAPIATLAIMDARKLPQREIAATLAMVLVMSQANVIWPMAVVGLDLPVIIGSSIVGGLIAAAFTYYVVGKNLPSAAADPKDEAFVPDQYDGKTIVRIMAEGGKEGLDIVLAAIPMLILALCLVGVLTNTGVIPWVSELLSPLFAALNLPDQSVLLLVTKFIAGGTAMMGVSMELLNSGALTAIEFNRLAGLMINPFDIVGVSVLLTAGKRVHGIAKVAMLGAVVGLLARGVFHWWWF